MKEQIKVIWMPKAKAMDFIVKGLLERSHAKFLENKRKDVVSEYLGGNVIIITTEADGECFQIALERSEIKDLPSDMQALLKKDLAIPAKKSSFSMDFNES